MADTTFRTVLPPLKAIDNGDGTFSIAIVIGGQTIPLPVLTTVQRNALTPQMGWLIYNSTTGQAEVYNGVAWVAVGSLYADGAIAVHAALATGIHGVGGSTIASVANIATHAGLTTGIHGVGGSTVASVADIATHTAIPNAHHSEEIAQGRVKGGGVTYLGLPGMTITSASTISIPADTVWYVPMVVTTPITLDQILIEVTAAAAAGKLARLGIYNADADWQPTTLVLDAGTVAIDAIAIVPKAIDQALQEGRYLLAYTANEAATLRYVVYAGAIQNAMVPTAWGNLATYWRVAKAYAAFSNPGTAWDTVGTVTSHRSIMVVRIKTP